MECNKIKNELVAYYYQDLDYETVAIISEHLKECQTCQQALSEIEKTLGLINKRVDIEPKEGFWSSYLEKVYQKIEEKSFLIRLYRNIFIEHKLAPVLAASLLIIVLLTSSSLYVLNRNKRYEKMQLSQNIELFQDFDIIQDFDLLDNFELLQEVEI